MNKKSEYEEAPPIEGRGRRRGLEEGADPGLLHPRSAKTKAAMRRVPHRQVLCFKKSSFSRALFCWFNFDRKKLANPIFGGTC